MIGIISDTHGLLRPEAAAALRGCRLLLHAGDVGAAEVLDALRRVAPVVAIRGNVDRGDWASELPEREVVEVDGVSIYMLHDLAGLDLDPVAAGFGVVVSGHTHAPCVEERRGVLYLNPGGAGPRRFSLPLSVARLTIEDGRALAEIVTLDVAQGSRTGRGIQPGQHE
jgi:putative phosphoesterase